MFGVAKRSFDWRRICVQLKMRRTEMRVIAIVLIADALLIAFAISLYLDHVRL